MILHIMQDNDRLRAENIALQQRLVELTEHPSAAEESAPAVVEDTPPKLPRRKLGRPVGHEPALRPAPRRIDRRQDVALPLDDRGKRCCPDCHTQLSQIKHHRRLVEDIVPAKVVATCYATSSGYCPQCRQRVESRDPDQPPPADLPHAQLGINALATAAVLRVAYRLPMRQVSQLFADLLGLQISPGAIAKQLQRMLRLKKQQGRMEAAAYGRQVKGLQTRLRNLGQRDWGDADADRLARRLRKYQDRLTVFLHDPAVAGTNNAAERALRPVVVMRKITGGNRSEKGAKAWAVLASVMRTMQQQGLPLVESIKTLLRGAWAGQDVVLLTELLDTS